ncbi:MAG: winged helix-turn-helix transcriptional regulator [Burkholderiaceae bacterium]|nr:winged helix-turn-helix transcriptional regulator [Rhodoferax sp.]MCP5285612.1 winged helix-turn-helix transcriptional regulator [Burkholderiaceae bacterium]
MSTPTADPTESTAAPTPDAPARVLKRFRQVFTATRTHYQQVEKHVGIGGAQVWALGIIGAQPGIGVGGLARAMHIHQSTASNLVRALVDRDLVSTAREGADRRAVQLRLLPAGTELLAKAPGPYTGLLVQALDRLDADTLARLELDLTRLAQAMGIGEDAPALPIAQL